MTFREIMDSFVPDINKYLHINRLMISYVFKVTILNYIQNATRKVHHPIFNFKKVINSFLFG